MERIPKLAKLESSTLQNDGSREDDGSLKLESERVNFWVARGKNI